MLRIALPIAYLALTACSPGDAGPPGNPEAKTYDLKGFNSVRAETGVELHLSQGPFAVSAQSKDGDLSRLSIEVRGDRLEIGSSSHFSLGRQPSYIVTVSAPAWKAIEASAGVKVVADNIQADDLSIEISAGVSAAVSGACKALTASVSAGSSLKAQDFKCASASVSAAAGASAEVYATDRVTASAAAGAKVSVHGHPVSVNKNASLGGSVETD